MAGLLLEQNQYINVASGIVVKDNTADGLNVDKGNNHMFDVYKVTEYTDLNKATGFVKQVEGSIFDYQNSNFGKVAFNKKSKYQGIIYDNWTKNIKSKDNTVYSNYYIADNYLEKKTQYYMFKDLHLAITIKPHIHYTCGTATTSECNHTGINSHSAAENKKDYIIEYQPLMYNNEQKDNGLLANTGGAFYLYEDMTGVNITYSYSRFILMFKWS